MFGAFSFEIWKLCGVFSEKSRLGSGYDLILFVTCHVLYHQVLTLFPSQMEVHGVNPPTSTGSTKHDAPNGVLSKTVPKCQGHKAVDRVANELNAEIQQETARTGQANLWCFDDTESQTISGPHPEPSTVKGGYVRECSQTIFFGGTATLSDFLLNIISFGPLLIDTFCGSNIFALVLDNCFTSAHPNSQNHLLYRTQNHWQGCRRMTDHVQTLT